MTFNGIDLYSTVVEKAAALGFSLMQNHPFVDGNKRVGQAAMEIFLVLNALEISAWTDDQETLILKIASGQLDQVGLTDWLRDDTVPRI
jgi:death on curing protein